MDNDTFAARLRRARMRATLTQEELADRAGITTNTLGALERGEHQHPYPATVRALVTALALTPEAGNELVASIPTRHRGGTIPPFRIGVPANLVPLIGRDHEVVRISGLLHRADVRLVTLTGPGGVGKTRLSLSIASALSDVFDYTVVLELASIGDSHLVAATIARRFGIAKQDINGVAERLQERVGDRRVLLLLDNFEHLLPAAPLLTDLLSSCSGLTIFVTSRVALRISGEYEVPTLPLTIPPSSRVPDLRGLHSFTSVQMFTASALAIDPEFTLTAENAPVIAALCQRLDGLPLALELAAARIPHLTPEAIGESLADRMSLLTAGRRDAPARHRTMRDTIDWSYQLLDVAHQSHFRQLSVFSGGFTLNGAAAVLSLNSAKRIEVLDALAQLIDHNLLRKVSSDGLVTRYSMLETVRDFAAEQLRLHGGHDLTRTRHATWCVEFSEECWQELYSVGSTQAVLRITAELDNLRAAMTWLYSSDQAELLQRLTGALGRYWHIAGDYREGRDWLERALGLAPDARSIAAARSLASAGFLAHCLGEDEVAVVHLARAAEIAREIGDPWMEAGAILDFGIVEEDRGQYVAAEVRFTQARALFEASDHRQGPLVAAHHLGIIAYAQGDLARAEELFESGIGAARVARDPLTLAWNLEYLGLCLAEQGENARAASALRACLTGSYAEATSLPHQARILAIVATLGSTLDSRSAVESASRLQAAAEVLNSIDGERFELPEREAFERAESRLRARLGKTGYGDARETGICLDQPAIEREIATILDAAGSTDRTYSAPGVCEG